jgi:hypothetical protein
VVLLGAPDKHTSKSWLSWGMSTDICDGCAVLYEMIHFEHETDATENDAPGVQRLEKTFPTNPPFATQLSHTF